MATGDTFGPTGFRYRMWRYDPATNEVGAETLAIDLGAGYAMGVTAIHVDGGAGDEVLRVGDPIEIGGNRYTVTAGGSGDPSAAEFDLTIDPGLVAAVADNDPVKTFYQALPKVVEFNGINEAGVYVSSTALGDIFKNMAPTGMSEFEEIVLKMHVRKTAGANALEADSAFSRIGRIGRRDDYPGRMFEAEHRTGISQAILVRPRINRIVNETEELVTAMAHLAIAAATAEDYVERGL